MAIKNYTTSVPANRSIEEIQSSLVKHGATGVMYEYQQGNGRISALRFRLIVLDKPVGFSLPVQWERFQEVLRQQKVKKWNDQDYVYRVAWRCIRDWVLSQMALYETQMIELPQVFLPFATDAKGETLFEKVTRGQFLLGNGE